MHSQLNFFAQADFFVDNAILKVDNIKTKSTHWFFVFLFLSSTSSLLITWYFLSCRAFQTKIISWFGRSFGQMTTDFQRPNFRNSSLTFPPKKCESLLANCGENLLQSIGNQKKQTNKQKTKQKQQQKTKKLRQGLLRFSPSFLFAFFLFYFPFFSV